jgi:hypothetical protein
MVESAVMGLRSTLLASARSMIDDDDLVLFVDLFLYTNEEVAGRIPKLDDRSQKAICFAMFGHGVSEGRINNAAKQ